MPRMICVKLGLGILTLGAVAYWAVNEDRRVDEQMLQDKLKVKSTFGEEKYKEIELNMYKSPHADSVNWRSLAKAIEEQEATQNSKAVEDLMVSKADINKAVLKCGDNAKCILKTLKIK